MNTEIKPHAVMHAGMHSKTTKAGKGFRGIVNDRLLT